MRLPRGFQALNLAITTVALALLVGAGTTAAAPQLRLAAADGALSISNSREGAAIFTAGAMRPGVEASGTVRIANTGTVTAAVRLGRTGAAVEAPGAGSGKLSARLDLTVIDVTVAQSPVTVYAGELPAMSDVDTGGIAPGAHRDFRFVATMPRAGASDNAFQGAQLTAGFTWIATGEEPEATPTPTPTPTPTAASTPTATPTPDGGGGGTGGGGTTTPPAGVSQPAETGATLGDQVFSMPAATTCVSRRRFKIHVRRPKGVTFKKVTITVNRKAKVKLKGLKARKLKATVSLRGLPKGKVVVKVVAETTAGAKLTSTRTYRTCAAKVKVKKKTRKTKRG
jgi:hypothetical protein